MKRLVIIFAVLGIAGTVAAFRGGALPGPGGGVGVSSTLVCLLSGGANCVITGSATAVGVVANTATATDDQVALGVTAGGAARFTGTVTAQDLTAARTWTMPNWTGTVPVPTTVGTTTTVLHGDASAQPVFGAVSLTADVSGTLPVANGGTGNTIGASETNCLYVTLGTSFYPAANTVLAQWKTGSASTLTDVSYGQTYAAANGASHTATIDVTDTSGTSLCHVDVACSTLTTPSTATASCASALTAATYYQIRVKDQCPATSNGGMNFCWKTTTP